MDRFLRISLLVLLAATLCKACGKAGDDGGGDGEGDATTTTEDPGSGLTDPAPTTPQTEQPLPIDASGVQSFLGPKVPIYAWDEDRYIAEGGTLQADGMMHCDFESECCWRNAHGPEDDIQWTLAAGKPDTARFSKQFFTDKLPDKQFAVAYSPDSEDPVKEARFFSCTVTQTNEPVKVTFRHWTSDDVRLRVCTRDAFYPENEPHLLNCKDVPRGNGPGPTTVYMPPGDHFDVVIVASNFIHSTGNIAAIDDIEVDYKLTDAGPDMEADLPFAFPTTAPPTPEECATVPCDFEDDTLMCGWQPGAVSETSVEWKYWNEGDFKNRVTGVLGKDQDIIRKYAVAYVTAGEKAAMVTEIPGGLFEERAFSFKYYDSVDGLVLRGCCNGFDDCPFSSEKQTHTKSRMWNDGDFPCPAGTDIVVFMCDNLDANQGACAVDDIEVVHPDTLEPVCPDGDSGDGGASDSDEYEYWHKWT